MGQQHRFSEPHFCLRLSPEPGSEVPEIPDGKDTGAPFEDTGITKPESGTTYSVTPLAGISIYWAPYLYKETPKSLR